MNSSIRRVPRTVFVAALGIGFLCGSLLSSTLLISLHLDRQELNPLVPVSSSPLIQRYHRNDISPSISNKTIDSDIDDSLKHQRVETIELGNLQNVRILVAIAAFDFSQLPHLEEVLDGYVDICAAGAWIDVTLYATVPYPITLIDLLNTRIAACNDVGHFNLTINLQSPSLRLHLVDLHRPLFYENLENYNLFIYTEDDIRITPRTVSSYLAESDKLSQRLGYARSLDYNVGIVRYEYNFPSNVAMDDKTRHITQNVTRVYWEHSYESPAIPKAVDHVPGLEGEYVHMKNHHQGMYLATRDRLERWKNKCQFDIPTNRPGKRSQPSEGTQRVWMSSQQLYTPRHCGVQQVIPFDSFGSLTVLHVPNKNYRRVGHFGHRNFSDGTETFDMGSSHLLTAMTLHLEMRMEQQKHHPSLEALAQHPYKGILMVDNVDRKKRWNYELKRKFAQKDFMGMLDRRMKDFHDYVARGGVLTPEDMTKTDLLDISPPPRNK